MENESGDDGLYLDETEQSQRYLAWSCIAGYRKLGFDVERIISMLGISMDEYVSIVDEFDLDRNEES